MLWTKKYDLNFLDTVAKESKLLPIMVAGLRH